MWALTFREFAALSERHKEQEERAFLRAAIVASTIANCHRDPKTKPEPFNPQDFMPGERKAPEVTLESQLMMIRQLNAAFGGEDLTNG